jgi:hypothetical protein
VKRHSAKQKMRRGRLLLQEAPNPYVLVIEHLKKQRASLQFVIEMLEALCREKQGICLIDISRAHGLQHAREMTAQEQQQMERATHQLDNELGEALSIDDRRK